MNSEMLQHRMAGKRAELAGDPQHHWLGIWALELDLALAQIGFDAVEGTEKIVIPEGAAEFAVGDGLQPDLFLLPDDLLDLAVFHRFQRAGRDLPALAFRARLLQRRGAQQAANMIGAERRCGALSHSAFLPPVSAKARDPAPDYAGFPLAWG